MASLNVETSFQRLASLALGSGTDLECVPVGIGRKVESSFEVLAISSLVMSVAAVMFGRVMIASAIAWPRA